MTLILSGTNGVSDIDGSAATPAIRGTDANTGIFFPAADTIAFSKGGVESMRITSAGDVGIGTASPAYKLDVSGTGRVTGDFYVGSSTNIIYESSSNLNIRAANSLLFNTSGANERMRIDSSGNLSVGSTTANAFAPPLTLSKSASYIWGAGPLPGTPQAFFVINNAGTGVYLADGGTSWTANSDERLKDIIEPITDAANKVATLRAVIGKYKTDEDGTRRSFLIAQDVQAVLPEAVNVQDDEQKTLGVQYTEVIPLLVAAIQEQQALITGQQAMLASLTARIEALEQA
jgi:hypothetical protein